MQVVTFLIDEQPFAFWDWNLDEKNMQFLNSIDSDYFKYMAEINVDHLEGENKHKAATSLISTYSQGLETFFALLSAVVQAPKCAVGWIMCYKRVQLKDVVAKIHNKKPIQSKLIEKPVAWDMLARFVHIYLNDNSKKDYIIKEYAKLWHRFANDFLDEDIYNEYNSIKHGMRIKQGGFTLMVGLENEKGKTAPKENMKPLGGSIYGSSYFVKEKIISDNKMNLRPRHHSRNWNPEKIANKIVLLSMSINNIISFLKCINGTNPQECVFKNPANFKDIGDLWNYECGVTKINFDTIIRPEDIEPFSREDIRKHYEQNVEK